MFARQETSGLADILVGRDAGAAAGAVVGTWGCLLGRALACARPDAVSSVIVLLTHVSVFSGEHDISPCTSSYRQPDLT